MRTAIYVTVTSLCAVVMVFITATTAILLTLFLKSVLSAILRILATIGEVGIATVAALSSGFTISLTVVLAAATSAVTFPPSQLEARLAISVAVATASMGTSAMALFAMTSVQLDVELAIAVVTTAAISVGFASAWAVGAMSLIERETHNVGLKMTSLLQAVRHNQYHVLKVLVRLPFGNQADELSTALLYAVKAGFVQCVQVLISAGANPNIQDAYENTPLICACQVGSLPIVRMLLEAQALVDFRNNSRETALHHCAKYGHDRCTELLLASGANPRVQDLLQKTPLMLAARHAPQPAEMLRILLDAGSDVNTPSVDHRTVLHYAAIRGIQVKQLLATDAKLDEKDFEGNTPLHLAASEGHLNVVTTLLESSADANAANHVNATPLHLASGCGHMTCVQELVRRGANPRTMDDAGNFPINHAVVNNKPTVVLFFLQQNCFPGARSRDQRRTDPGVVVSPVNPVNLAMEKNFIHLAKLLVQGGCDSLPLKERNLIPERRVWQDHTQMVNFFWLRNFIQQPVGLLERCRAVIRRQLDNPVTDCKHLPIPNQLRLLLILADLGDVR
ncbi:hypothetical protein LSH36_256g05003 [Paralvinella palmiformis]|uniref:Ankyrin repeat protein n=1 Tax=Paralvinella palmiformis TaxID=53620 RepID=A0AAD9JLS8_9ANNE|nr:hypothetical protein LSH36_256g05003 [Paralvinella palmiformis]